MLPTSPRPDSLKEKEDGHSYMKKPISATQSIPSWLPISLLAVTSAALVVPVVLLRRHRKNTATTSALQQASAPPRRSAAIPNEFAKFRPAQTSKFPPGPLTKAPVEIDRHPSNDNNGDFFNAPLYTLKAFSIATALVSLGAATSIWGVKTFLGVHDTKEFADQMRNTLLTKMPVLSSRIHRAFSSENVGSTTSHANDSSRVEVEWNWPDAENRLKEAFDKGGFSGWAQAALLEVEAEGRFEQAKRHIGKDADNHTTASA
ncbi:hypothetical protein SERLA73DRAFT_117168 [Serpula lacrymans var. lacrymans S7.3]|uniref:Uncharacterized protein n=2 Tax=Serpula lacrymans var. lacrymans TaxID=341189 RepID=F8QGL4_SERL3|nr:uncharacterized protein SERLADRAFT_445138 [Serpula lacrymans var. lacrymans S7.9]EGN92560.1 hypothetical protein SERLA73DRAFT_117168 [Serpula lacrymans var. lacrymans S7.3]EGO29307.1 hypothetical protein SERLADRAFT_445138 [Serpula lacrymans var. lacrymans S7.9]